MIRVSCLIPAAGLGERFRKSKSGSPAKLDLPLGEKRLLEKTLEPFLSSPEVKEIILAVPPDKAAGFRARLKSCVSKRIKVVAGGASRTESVYRALGAVDPKISWVMVHDGARPLFDRETLKGFLRELPRRRSLIVARPVVPTLKRAARGNSIEGTVSREGLWEAETPQGFEKKILLEAYRSYLKNPFLATDEASLVERIGHPIFLFENKKPNPKITTFADYLIAQKLEDSDLIRVGIGYDIHRLVKGRCLILGGIPIPFEKGSLGHSDGDAVLHALSDAMLGALSLGDIGEHFPDTSRKTLGIAGRKILSTVYERVKEKGFVLSNADINLILERPKLKSYKEKMKNKIASILNVPASRISLKARTSEGLGPIGRGEAVAVQAIVGLKRGGLE